MSDQEAATNSPRPAGQPWIDTAKLSLRWRQFRQEIRRQKHWWLKRHTPYQALFVLATRRSGSTLLLDYLWQLPGVAGHGEVLCPPLDIGPIRERLTTRQAIRHIRRSLQTRPAPIRGCKLMLHQMLNHQVTLSDLDREFPGAKYLIIYRESLAEQFVSLKLAEATQQWTLMAGEKQKQRQVTIDPAELRSFCDESRAAYRHVLGHPGLPQKGAIISYEELTAAPALCLGQKICPLLGLPPREVKAGLRKQNTQPFATRVANYAQVAKLLESTQCQQHFDWPARPAARSRAAA